MINLICFFIMIFCIALRLVPRIIWENFNGTDSYFHFYYINLIKQNNHKILKTENRVLGGSNECTYPFFYHWVLSFFSVKFISFWDKFSGFVFDFLNGISVLLLISLIKQIQFYEGCLILASYVIAPGLTFSFIGPRPYSLTPRSFSQFIFCIGCIFLITSSTPIEGLNVFLFISASIAFSILLLSSQFGIQVLFFILLFSIFYLKIVLAILLGILLGLIPFKSFLVTQIKAHIHHLEWYYKYNYSFVEHKTNFNKLINFIKERNLRGIFYEIVFYNQIFTSIFRHPTFFISLFFALNSLYVDNLNSIQKDIVSILIPLFIAFLVTNFGKARVFGEAERYIEFCYPLQFTLFLSFVSETYVIYVLSLILAYNFIWYCYNLYQIKYQHASLYSYNEVCSYLLEDDIKLLCLNNNESYIFLKNTNVNVVGFLVNISLKGAYHKFFSKFFSKYPLVNSEYIKEICEEYKVTHILKNKGIKKDEISQYEQAISALSGFIPIYEDQKYVLYCQKDAN